MVACRLRSNTHEELAAHMLVTVGGCGISESARRERFELWPFIVTPTHIDNLVDQISNVKPIHKSSSHLNFRPNGKSVSVIPLRLVSYLRVQGN